MRSAVTVLLLAALVGIAAPASAATTNGDDYVWKTEPWEPFRSEASNLPAGEYCDYELGVEIAEDDEFARVLARYRDGKVAVTEYKGTLILDFTNTETGRQIRRDASGRGWDEVDREGLTKRFTGAGPFASRHKSGGTFPKGQYILDGLHSYHYDEERHKIVDVAVGTQENVCNTLS